MNATGKDWTASCLATKIKEIFVQRRTESAIMLKWKEENLEKRNTEDEITEDDLRQVKRSHKEQGATMQRESHSISMPNVSEVITIAVNGRSEDDSEDHPCNSSTNSVQLTQEPKPALNNNLTSHAHLVNPSLLGDSNNQLHTPEVEILRNRTSQRTKKPPRTKTEDFLW
jgi:hypothetical protein